MGHVNAQINGAKHRKAMFAMSGDPIQSGHVDIIERAAAQVDELIVGIGVNPGKNYLFTLEDKLEMTKNALAHIPNVTIIPYSGFLVDYAFEQCIPVVVKSGRNAADFQYEEDLHVLGSKLTPGIETLFLTSKPELKSVSSTAIKGIHIEKGFIPGSAPLFVKSYLDARISSQYIIGVTGEPGCGKSYLCEQFEELSKKTGIPVHNIELDYIGHQIIGELQEPRYKLVREQIVETFGEGVRQSEGVINRKALGEIVFNNKEQMEKLNEIMLNLLLVRFRRELSNKKGLILLNAALIAESDLAYLCNNNVVLVDADKESQMGRLRKRKGNSGQGLTDNQIQRRLESQYNLNEKRISLEGSISRDRQGTVWNLENSDASDPANIEKLFYQLVKEVDMYGELRFRAMWERIGADGTPDAEFGKLMSAYSDSKRFYHTIRHIVNSLDSYEEAKHLMKNPEEVLFSLFYHDSTMNQKSRVDEERSAQVAYSACKNAMLSEEFATNVKNNILATKHNCKPLTMDAMLTADIDLVILGSSPEEFNKYDAKIQNEFDWVPRNKYQKERALVLEHFLQKDQIYYSDFFKEKYEAQARINLACAIGKLRDKSI